MNPDKEPEMQLAEAREWLGKFFAELGLSIQIFPAPTVLDEDVVLDDILDAEIIGG